MTGLLVFTLASLWCGLTRSVEMLIVARVAQGLGASMITPQTMAIITRIFPVARRGKAMALWGATAGVATLVGPILGGILVDALGWEWIFFINIPVGVIGLVLAARLVPHLDTHTHRFDWLGVALSGVGMFLLVFGIQEGHQYHWNATIWTMILVGAAVLVAFVVWQARNRQEPLVPLGLFRDRNYSLANVAITVMGFAITALAIPLMLWAQVVRGLSPTRSALLLVPMAVMSILLARPVGGLTDRAHPRLLVSFGFSATVVSLVWLAHEMTPDVSIAAIIGPMVLLGIGNAFIWAPNSATATRNLPMHQAGAGAGVYNATRQVGAVLGSAAIAVLIDARLAAEGLPAFEGTEGTGGRLPAAFENGFSDAMAASMLLPAGVLLLGLLAALLFERPRHEGFSAAAPASAGAGSAASASAG
jgi:EmrB/QacA subfamily drug resistance transporter